MREKAALFVRGLRSEGGLLKLGTDRPPLPKPQRILHPHRGGPRRARGDQPFLLCEVPGWCGGSDPASGTPAAGRLPFGHDCL